MELLENYYWKLTVNYAELFFISNYHVIKNTAGIVLKLILLQGTGID